MRIRMLAGLSGPAYALLPGDERDFPNDEALRLIQSGAAVAAPVRSGERTVRPKPKAETR